MPSVVVTTTIFENHILAGTTNWEVTNTETGKSEGGGTVVEGNPGTGIGGAAKKWGVVDWDDSNDEASNW